MKSTAEGLQPRSVDAVPPPQRVDQDAFRGGEEYSIKLVEDSPMFSPFPFYFQDSDGAPEKKGEKTLIGLDGWLEKTDQDADKGKKNALRKLGIWDGFKKMAKDVVSLCVNLTFSAQPANSAQTDLQGKRLQSAMAKEISFETELTISLNAREQSLLYGELEYHLSSALNTFITLQLEKGRLATDKLKKIVDGWLAQGRPRVVGFRYDLETQIELVILHAEPLAGGNGTGCYFVFCGRRQGNPSEIAGLLQTMRVNARAMRVRTYCQPDSVIAKQLVDSRSLFDMLGVDKNASACLTEIADFFQVCRDREEEKRERERKRIALAKMKHDNLERWERHREEKALYESEMKRKGKGERYSEDRQRWI
jgi:hypothetical protein